MLERPAIDDETLIGGLRERFGLPVDRLAFVALGNDSGAWTYRADSGTGAWFVKVLRDPRTAGILVPRFLRAHGLTEVVAARQTLDGEPWAELGVWHILVYPFVDAASAMRVGLGDDGWRRLGAFAARLHALPLPRDLAAIVPREDFRPRSNDLARRVAAHVAAVVSEGGPDLDETARRVVDMWPRHRPVIAHLVDRSEALGQRIRDREADAGSSRFVTCHADLHANNVLVAADGGLAIIDWDEVMLAPPERDLMFVRGSVVAGRVTDAQATAFETGYGSGEADPLLIAWYRIDWAVQDLADFARRVLFDPDAGAETRGYSLDLFASNFEPGGQVESALAADDALG